MQDGTHRSQPPVGIEAVKPEEEEETAPSPLSYLDAFDYELPPERIAQRALAERDASKLLVFDRKTPDEPNRHTHVSCLPSLLNAGDLLVVNATRVLPARLVGTRESGGAAEALILGPADGARPDCFRALVKISGRLRPRIRMRFEGEAAGATGDTPCEVWAEVQELGEQGEVTLAFTPGASPYSVGRAPLPPYIRRGDAGDEAGDDGIGADLARYQTIFARVSGAIAAPTAGLHLTQRLFDALEDAGVSHAEVVLHVGAGTFRPLRAEDLLAHRLHAERFELPEATAKAIDETRRRGGRVVAVGTTVARVLETRGSADGRVEPGVGETELFLRPGDSFSVVDALLTNFHLPRSSLLLLVAAFAGRERVLAAYRDALAHAYRFYSYGDAMLIL